MESVAREINENGYSITDNFFDHRIIIDLEAELNNIGAFDFTNTRVGETNLLQYGPVAAIAAHSSIVALLSVLFPLPLKPVKAFILDKSVHKNWNIPWHQDLKIPLQERANAAGFSNWTLEADIWHVQPPVDLLAELIVLRIHFDACSAINGAMRLFPGSHKAGILKDTQVQELLALQESVLASVSQYGVMFMKPLVVHDSPASCSAQRRRILQLEYGPDLPAGLRWHV
jgi:ectoine hydroxylase-related dioxygenase (phytanoyl-CoA dioxygenase family)